MFCGQLVFREVGHDNEKLAGKGHQLFMVVGVVAVPKVFGIEGEHQYTIAQKPDLYALMGDSLPMVPEQASLVLLLDSGVDQSEVTIGDSIGGALLQPIWRI